MKKALITLAFAGLAVGCGGDVPTDTDGLTPQLAVAGSSGCYTVHGTISETGFFPNFTGVIDGDLVGTSSTLLSFDVGFAGAVIFNPGERTLEITGGIIPELIGKTVHETFEGLTISDAPPLLSINERTRIDAGAEQGNLTTHGTLNWDVFPWEVEAEYRGVICP